MAVGKFGLKVLITSRPEFPAELDLKLHEDCCYELKLHLQPRDVVERDVFAYLKHRIGTMQARFGDEKGKPNVQGGDWPTQEGFDALLRISRARFVFAEAICRFIGDERFNNQDQQIEYLLRDSTEAKTPEGNLTRVYKPMLERFVADADPDDRRRLVAQFHEIVGTIVVLADPLSICSLASLINKTDSEIEDHLHYFHSFLDISREPDLPVRFSTRLSETFCDLGTHGPGQEFSVNIEYTHHRLAYCCLKVMGKELKKDVCQLEWPGIKREEILPTCIQQSIPAALRYACSYWIYHLQNAGMLSEREIGLVYEFLQSHFLHWVEVLVLIGKVWTIGSLLEDLQGLLEVRLSSSYYENANSFSQGSKQCTLVEFLQDAQLWIREHATKIDMAPLQIYSAALLFSPQDSIVRKTFLQEIPDWVSTTHSTSNHWKPENVQTFRATGKKTYEPVDVSHDWSLVAAVSREVGYPITPTADNFWMIVWEAETGVILHSSRIAVMRDSARDMTPTLAFSADSRLLAVGLPNRVCIWRTDIFEYVQSFQVEEMSPATERIDFQKLTFSPNSDLLAAVWHQWKEGTDQAAMIGLWDIQSGNRRLLQDLPELHFTSSDRSTVEFSSDSSRVGRAAIGTAQTDKADTDYIFFHVWDISTGDLVVNSKASTGFISWFSPCFSKDLSLLACLRPPIADDCSHSIPSDSDSINSSSDDSSSEGSSWDILSSGDVDSTDSSSGDSSFQDYNADSPTDIESHVWNTEDATLAQLFGAGLPRIMMYNYKSASFCFSQVSKCLLFSIGLSVWGGRLFRMWSMETGACSRFFGLFKHGSNSPVRLKMRSEADRITSIMIVEGSYQSVRCWKADLDCHSIIAPSSDTRKAQESFLVERLV